MTHVMEDGCLMYQTPLMYRVQVGTQNHYVPKSLVTVMGALSHALVLVSMAVAGGTPPYDLGVVVATLGASMAAGVGMASSVGPKADVDQVLVQVADLQWSVEALSVRVSIVDVSTDYGAMAVRFDRLE
jgi:hypothetical protein